MPVTGAIERIRQNLDRLTPSEGRVAAWILANPAQCMSFNVRELATASQTSQSAVIRFCHTLQFKSFPDLKMSIVADLSQDQQETPFAFSEINPSSPFHAIRMDLEHSLVSSIQNTLRGVREDTLDQVSQLIVHSQRILVFGSGASSVVALDIQQKLQRLGYNVWASADFHTAATLAAHFTTQDLLIAVSYSGRTTDVLEIAEIVHRNRGEVVAITGYGLSPLGQSATVSLPIAASEVSVRVGATSSLLASLAVVNTLLLYLVNKYPESALASLKSTRDVVSTHLKPS